MMQEHKSPTYVYRLATQQEWRDAKETGTIPEREIDRRDGYLHLSTRDQVLETAKLHFAEVDDLLALEIPFDAIAQTVKFELAAKRGTYFPHFYGQLSVTNVANAICLEPDGDGFIFGSIV